MNPPGKPIYFLEDIEVDTERGCLRRGGREQYLRRQTFQVLLCLLERHPRLVTKEELIDKVWKGTAVSDNALVQCITDIRKALGDDSRSPRFVKTIPKIGYRFIGPVEENGQRPHAIIETEEIISAEIEVREKTGEPEARGREAVPARSPISGTVPSRRVRVALVCALVLISAGAAAFFVYSAMNHSRARREQAEAGLPHVPGKKRLAVMYFDNQSNTPELDWLREGLADMLITSLSRSKQLTVLDRQQLRLLMERIGHDARSRVGLNEALDIARRSRAEAVALGRFVKLGERVRIDVEIYDAGSGEQLAAETMSVDTAEQILMQVDLLALKLASHLGSAPPEQGNTNVLTEMMTNNLEAYRYYSLALEKAQEFDPTQAIALLEKAVALDPQFAMAHARIGYVYALSWAYADEAKPYLEKAFQHSHRLTEKDRLYIRAWYAVANRDFPEAVEAFRTILAQYPFEVEAYQRLGQLLIGEERLEEAVEVLQQGLVIDSEARNIHNTLGNAYSRLGRHAEALAAHQRYVALAPEDENAHDSLGLSYQWAGQYESAIAEYTRALELNPHFEVALIHRANAYFQQGRYREALEQYQQYIQNAPSDFERARGFETIGLAYLKKGDLNRAEANIRRATRYGISITSGLFALALAQGKLAQAESLIDIAANSPFTNRGARNPARYHHYFVGSLALKKGDAPRAIENFKRAIRSSALIFQIDPLEDCLANAYLELGRLDEAIAEYERILRLNPNYPLAYYHLGQAYERKGQQDRARSAYQQFLQIWQMADADIPELATVKQKLARSQH